MSIQQLSSQAQLAQASYASLSAAMSADRLVDALKAQNDGFTETQAQQFAAKFSVVLQYNDDASILVGNGTSLSLTIFKDTATNQLTLAIRGTSDPADWATANNSIVVGGAAYPQIAALHNWWLRATAAPGTPVAQYQVITGAAGDPSALALTGGDYYLVRKDDAAATGELRSALVADPDQGLEVTGHSTGGHLAMAFGALFDASTASVASFNAPGFRDSATNQAFFAALGGALPSQVSIGNKTTNVIADEVRQADVGFNPIAGLWTLPGTRIDVPIEDQWLSGEPLTPDSYNHSQMILSDALAVYALFDKLSPSVSTAAFDGLLRTASNKEFTSLEALVDGLRALLASGASSLPAGNDKREDLHLGIKSVTDASAFAALAGQVRIEAPHDASAARNDFAALLSLTTGATFSLRLTDPSPASSASLALYGVHRTAYEGWLLDRNALASGADAMSLAYTDSYLNDRATWANAVAAKNKRDEPYTAASYGDGLDPVSSYQDMTTGIVASSATLGTPNVAQIAFGSEGSDSGISGSARGDRLYGGGGSDNLSGLGGDDWLEGNRGDDTLDGGADNDTLLGGAGSDTYNFSATFGRDLVIDADGWGRLQWNGGALPQGLRVFDGLWQSANRQVTYTLVRNPPGTDGIERHDLVISFAGGTDRIVIRGWSETSHSLGIGFGGDFALPATTQNIIGDFTKKTVDRNGVMFYEMLGDNYVADAAAGPSPGAHDRIDGLFGAEAVCGAQQVELLALCTLPSNLHPSRVGANSFAFRSAA